MIPHLLVLPVILGLAAAAPSRAAAPLARDLPAPARSALARAGTLVNGPEAPRGYALLDSLAGAARARADTTLLLATAVSRGGHLGWAGRSREAVLELQWALPLAEARNDSALQVTAATWLGYALVDRGRSSAAESLYVRQLPVAAAIGDTLHEGFMHKGLAYLRLLDGRTREALAGFRRAEPLLRAAGNSFGEIDAITGQGRAWEQLGELDRARATYERVARLSREHNRPHNEADALNNLGNLEFVRGDPAAGLRAFRATRALRERLGIVRNVVVPACNEARALAELGRIAEADATLDSMVTLCREQGFVPLLGHVLNDQAELRLRQGRPAEALCLSREVLAQTTDLPVWARTQAYRLAARALAAQDSNAAALALLEGPAAGLRSKLSPDWALRHDEELVDRLLDGGRAAEAVALALAAADNARALRRARDRVALLVAAARGAMAMGDTAAALPHLVTAARVWEEARVLPLDLEWRERRSGTQVLSEAMILARLAATGTPSAGDARVEAAFDDAQRFKARTLAERARLNAPVDTAGIVTASRLRREILRDGEVLLDIHVGRRVSHAFLLGREVARVVRLPGEAALAARMVLLRDLLANRATSASDQGAVLELAATTAQDLLGELVPHLVAARRVLVSPDGPFYLVPADVLLAGLGPAASRPLPEAWPDVARVPSADLFARTRAWQRGTAVRARGAIVVAEANDAGDPLPGAREEALRLERDHRQLVLWQAPPDSAESGLPASLSGYQLIHFASHAALDDQRPWRSGILVAAPGRGRPARWMRAGDLAARPLEAQLVVLAACASAGGEVLAGEGLQGLSSAFLAAGVPTLVATLWPVDDRATARLMERFYERLAAGDPVGVALRAARADAARQGGSPADWAAFVVVGDPDRRIDLGAPRRMAPAAVGAAIMVALVMGALAVRRRLARGRRDNSGVTS
ncbi:MAG: CHAT domain-containing protein [bacterium]|nr:CHAT domain-containing protein [bacterium]